MLKLLAALIVMLCGLLASGQAINYSIYTERSVKFTELVNGFSNPPQESRLRCYWWWVNRLIGDGKLPEDQRLTKTNIVKFNAPDAEKYLRASGLIGPVSLKIVNQHILKSVIY